MKHLLMVAVLALASCGTTAPAFADPTPTPPPPPPVTEEAPPPRLTPAEIARLLPPPPAPEEPSMWYGPFDLRTASIA